MRDVERKFWEKLQPLIEQDMQVMAELERKHARFAAEMNRRMIEAFIEGNPNLNLIQKTYKL
jgi:hypothetical protein